MTAPGIPAGIIIILLVLLLAGLMGLKRSLAEMRATTRELLTELKNMNRNIYGYTKKTNDVIGYRLSPETDDRLREIISRLDRGLRDMSEAPGTEVAAALKGQERLLKEINEKLALIGYNTDRRPRLEDDPF